eukprot:1097652-Pelagomonas_calceolata.AAC.4
MRSEWLSRGAVSSCPQVQPSTFSQCIRLSTPSKQFRLKWLQQCAASSFSTFVPPHAQLSQVLHHTRASSMHAPACTLDHKCLTTQVQVAVQAAARAALIVSHVQAEKTQMA